MKAWQRCLMMVSLCAIMGYATGVGSHHSSPARIAVMGAGGALAGFFLGRADRPRKGGG